MAFGACRAEARVPATAGRQVPRTPRASSSSSGNWRPQHLAAPACSGGACLDHGGVSRTRAFVAHLSLFGPRPGQNALRTLYLHMNLCLASCTFLLFSSTSLTRLVSYENPTVMPRP